MPAWPPFCLVLSLMIQRNNVSEVARSGREPGAGYLGMGTSSSLGRTLVALALGEPYIHRGPTELFVKWKNLEEAESPFDLHAPPPTPRATPLQPSCDLVVTFPWRNSLRPLKQLP